MAFRASILELKDDAAEMLDARIELARLEAEIAARQVKKLAISLALFSVVMLVGLVVLIVLAADLLAPHTLLSREAWLGALGGALLLGGAAASWASYRTFRRNFTAFSDSLAELKEDAAWIREMLGTDER